MSSQKGTSTSLIVLVVAVLVLLGGAYLMMKPSSAPDATMQGADAGAVVGDQNTAVGGDAVVPATGTGDVKVGDVKVEEKKM